MDAEIKAGVEAAVGVRLGRIRPVSGGDINQAFAAEVGDGRSVFVKTNASPPPGMFKTEAHGLRWLDEAGALPVPQVLAVDARFLVLEYLEPAHPRPGFDEELGRGLAALHRFGAPSFGLDRDNFIGRLPQKNSPSKDWAAFYRERRIAPMVRSAVENGFLPLSVARRCDELCEKLADLVGPAEPPARLHGDLWGGNLHVMPDGRPCLVDPSVYGGHREIDLAMMQLFGGFGPRVFSAYREAWPLAPGHEERVPLYQLYPLLVHVNLFGGSYVGGVERALRQLI